MTVIKRYSNRKLYDSEARRYVRLEEIGEMIRNGEDVRIVDHQTGSDLTSLVLLQVVLEQEKLIGGILPSSILKRIIQKGDKAFEQLRISLHAFSDPMLFVDQEIQQRLECLAAAGKLSSPEYEHLSAILVSSNNMSEPQEESFSEENTPAQKEEFKRLSQELDRLEAELKKLRTDR